MFNIDYSSLVNIIAWAEEATGHLQQQTHFAAANSFRWCNCALKYLGVLRIKVHKKSELEIQRIKTEQ